MRVAHNHDGALILSEWVTDKETPSAFLHNRTYYGYTVGTARKMYAKYLKDNGLTPERGNV